MKGYKVTDSNRIKRVGVGCLTLQELVQKGCKKLSIDNSLVSKVVVKLEDGTTVDDEAYFATLPQNTVLLLCLPGEEIVTLAEMIYDALQKLNTEYFRAAALSYKFLTEDMKKKFRVLGDMITKQEDISRRDKSHRKDDPDWFKGLDTNAETKEQFMFRKAQDRIRGYLYKSCDDLKKSPEYKENVEIRLRLDRTMEFFRRKLSYVHYFGSYFDRKWPKESARLCNPDGNFQCQGVWRKTCCTYTNHVINPYDSREARILFSTWNLDHRIERTRTVIPALLVAAELACCQDGQINMEYFFNLLFTNENLKIVHIVCHDKGAHNVVCNTLEFTNTKKQQKHQPEKQQKQNHGQKKQKQKQQQSRSSEQSISSLQSCSSQQSHSSQQLHISQPSCSFQQSQSSPQSLQHKKQQHKKKLQHKKKQLLKKKQQQQVQQHQQQQQLPQQHKKQQQQQQQYQPVLQHTEGMKSPKVKKKRRKLQQ